MRSLTYLPASPDNYVSVTQRHVPADRPKTRPAVFIATVCVYLVYLLFRHRPVGTSTHIAASIASIILKRSSAKIDKLLTLYAITSLIAGIRLRVSKAHVCQHHLLRRRSRQLLLPSCAIPNQFAAAFVRTGKAASLNSTGLCAGFWPC